MKASNLTEISITDVEHRLYLLMRTDLQSMNPGKAMSQAAHAANLFADTHCDLDEMFKWQGGRNGRGFGTTITLGVDYNSLVKVLVSARTLGVVHGKVVDETYPYIVTEEIYRLLPPNIHTAEPMFIGNGQVVLCRKETTCGYVFTPKDGITKETLLGDLKLHP